MELNGANWEITYVWRIQKVEYRKEIVDKGVRYGISEKRELKLELNGANWEINKSEEYRKLGREETENRIQEGNRGQRVEIGNSYMGNE